MAGLFHGLIKKLGAHGEAGPHFNGSPEGRMAIRKSLALTLPGTSVDALADLSQRPRVAGWHISISHTTDFGAWVATTEPCRIGLDIERRDRLRLEVIRRVCGPGEFEHAPHPIYLWGAKEACFKGTVRQPQTISDIKISDWIRDDESADLWQFRAGHGNGWVGEEDGRIFALYAELSQPKNT